MTGYEGGSAGLVAFLKARLDEDEAAARQVASNYGDQWTAEGDDRVRGSLEYVDVLDAPASPTEYIARHDPARVLREVEWKRSLVSLCANVMAGREATAFAPGVAWTIMTRMANDYRDHPDWRPYWPGSG